MEKIEIDGILKVSSSMDLNTYILTTKAGRYLGEMSVSDLVTQERIERVFIEKAKADGELKSNENQVKGGFKASIKIEISARK